jgi:NAD(P)-dependent dehydrogenase (short-subunit alcohol dehydrogenase family)
MALTLSDHGAHCILVSRKLEGLQEVAGKIEENGAKAIAIACHMGYLNQIESLFKTVRKQFGRLDILVNNAGTNPYFGEMLGADEAAWDKTHDVNLKGPFFMVKHAARLMVKAGGGAIVNVASVSGMRPGLMQGIYSITKAGLIAMTKAYAKELADKNIRVNALLPGLIKTQFSKILIETKEIYDQAVKRIPMGRHAEPGEMAGAVLYLVSDAASFTTGICLTCDGGYLA